MPKDKQDKGAKFELPSDLSALGDDELASAIDSAVAEFDELDNDENLDVGGVARMGELTDHIEAMRGQQEERANARAQAEAEREGFRSRVHAKEVDDEESAAIEDEDTVASAKDEEDLSLTASGRRKTPVENVIKDPRSRLNVRLSEARQQQPRSTQPSAADLNSFEASVLVASADIPGFTQGGRIEDGMQLVQAFKNRARSMPVSRSFAGNRPIMGRYQDFDSPRKMERDGYNAYGLLGYEHNDWREAGSRVNVAQLQRDFRYKLDSNASPEEAFEVMQAAANPQALVAAGGWCSPSEISYDFYNIVAEDGAYDLPTTGIRRGGMRWPTSPSFGDLASSTGLWHWTETQDIAAATGTAQSGTKTCARVPCAAFNEARLEGEGVCITAGNLTTDAWPEQIANFLRLVNAAHFHRVNSYFITNVIAQSTAVSHTGVAGISATTMLLASIENQVWDIRTKYAMADTDVLEVVLPSWVLGLLRADLSRRSGLATLDNAFSVTNAMIASWFTERSVRVQFVQDFDVRGSNQFGQSSAIQAWPSSVRYIIYPAGTFVRGNGMNLDLGIIRDSTLNATNDYTAAWSEEFFLLAKIGHESRVVTISNMTSAGALFAPVAVTTVI